MTKKQNYIKKGTINLTNDNLSDLYSIISKFEKHIEKLENDGMIIKFKMNDKKIFIRRQNETTR